MNRRCDVIFLLIFYSIFVCNISHDSGRRYKIKIRPEELSLWKIPVLMLNSGTDISQFVCPRCYDVFQFFIVVSMKLVVDTLSLCIFNESMIQPQSTKSNVLLQSINAINRFFFLIFASSLIILLIKSCSMVSNELLKCYF